jgi:hypothetical protein
VSRAAAVVVTSAALLLGLCGCGASPTPSETATSAYALTVGDCMRDSAGEASLDSVQIVDCAEPHEFEVYASVALPGDRFPGAAAIDELADPQCRAAFEALIGIPRENSRLAYDLVYPTQESWQAGDREVLCRVAEPDGRGGTLTRTGSLAGSNS